MDHAAIAVAEFLNLAKDLPSGAFISVPAQIASKVIEGYKLADRNKRHAASLVTHTCDLMVPLMRAAHRSKDELDSILIEELNSLPKLLTEVQESMLQITGRGTFSRLMKRHDDKELIEDLNQKLRQRLKTFEVKSFLNVQIGLNTNEHTRRQDHVQTHTVLGTNQAEIMARLDQLQITTSVNTRARPSPLRRVISPHFTGRTDLVSRAVTVVTGSLHPHLSFFGTAGIGKTSVALAVAHHEGCVERFGDYRYFVDCEALSSASAVRSSILQALAGSRSLSFKGDAGQILTDMLTVDRPVLLIIDNFETPWNTAGQRAELTELLKDITAIPDVRLITTLRSDDAPASADVAWTRIPVKVLEPSAARRLFLSITPTTDEAEHQDLDLLLKEVDYLPLAVKLLAELKKQQTCSELLQRWYDTKTSLVKTERQGGTRLASLDVSISLSLHSPLLDDASRNLLATICQLPAGIIGGRPKLKAMDLGFRDLDEHLDALLEVALLIDDRATGRITMPPPIRAYVSSQIFHTHEEQLETYYIARIEHWDQLSTGDAGYVEKQDALLAEVDNIRYFFQHRMIHHPSLKLGRAVFAFTYLEYCLRPSTQLITCLTNQLKRIGWEENRPSCSLRLVDVHSMLGKYTEAEHELQAARAQFAKIGNRRGTAQCLQRLAEIHRRLSQYAEAEHELLAAQAQFVEIGDRHGIAECLQRLADIHRMLNKYAEAEHELRAAHAQSVEIGDRHGIAQCLHSLAEIHKMLDQYDEAEHELRAAQALFVEIGDRLGTARCLQSLASVHKVLHQYIEAEHELQAARAQFVEIGDGLGTAHCLRSLAEIHGMLQKHIEAEHELQAAQAQLLEIGDKLGTAQCLQSLAEIFRQQQRWRDAETSLAEAELIATSLSNHYEQAWICQYRGRLYKAQRRYVEARAQCTLSRDLFLTIGLTADADDVMKEAEMF